MSKVVKFYEFGSPEVLKVETERYALLKQVKCR